MIPHRLRAATDFVRRHHRMRGVDFRTVGLRNEPVPCDGNAADGRGVATQIAFPALEVDRTRIGRQHHELGEGDARTLSQIGGRLERLGAVARQAENERAQHMHAVRSKRLQAFDELFAHQIESLVDIFQPFRRDRLHADQRAADSCARHRLQERGSSAASMVICVKNTMSSGELGQSLHQRKALGANGFELAQVRPIAPARSLGQVGKRHRVEIVIGQRDEPEPSPSQLHRFVDHGIDAALPRSLAIGAPHRAERAVLRAPAHRLDRSPHVAAARQEIPPGRLERRRHRFVPLRKSDAACRWHSHR